MNETPENTPATFTSDQKAELQQQLESQMDGLDFGALFKAAVHTINEVGIKQFFTNPRAVVARTIITLAENNQLPAPPKPETEIKQLDSPKP